MDCTSIRDMRAPVPSNSWQAKDGRASTKLELSALFERARPTLLAVRTHVSRRAWIHHRRNSCTRSVRDIFSWGVCRGPVPSVLNDAATHLRLAICFIFCMTKPQPVYICIRCLGQWCIQRADHEERVCMHEKLGAVAATAKYSRDK